MPVLFLLFVFTEFHQVYRKAKGLQVEIVHRRISRIKRLNSILRTRHCSPVFVRYPIRIYTMTSAILTEDFP
jgi:hypothetical protein